LGIGINTTQEYAVITCILDASCAQTAGLYVGDKIISINNNKVLAKDLEKTLEACSEGE
jgi:predicted metalloprotease with PDZ domain